MEREINENRVSMTRSYYWDNLKGVLITFVVAGHLCELFINESSLLEHAWIIIYSFHMPLFVFVNGYFARKSCRTGRSKAIKMLGYYLLMQLLFDLGRAFVLGESPDYDLIAVPEYCCWYLLFLVYAYLITDFLPKEKRNLIKLAAVLMIISLVIGFDDAVGHSYAVGRTFYFLPYFIGGSIVYEYVGGDGTIASKKRSHLIIYVAAMIIMVVLLWLLGDMAWFNRITLAGHVSYYDLYPNNACLGMMLKLGAYLVAAVIGYLVLKIIPTSNTFFALLGKHTLNIYLVHIFLLPILFPFVDEAVLLDNVYLHTIMVALVLVLATAMVLLIISLIKRKISNNKKERIV